MGIKHEFDPDWCVHPGAVVLEFMCVFFVHGTQINSETMEAFVNGEQELTPELLEVLVDKTGMSPEFWQNYERIFREGLAAGKSWIK